MGGLLTALAIALFGFNSSEFLDQRQAAETNTRLYSELMSRREESESALRKDMFVSIIGSFVKRGQGATSTRRAQPRAAGLQLPRVAQSQAAVPGPEAAHREGRRRGAERERAAEQADYMDRLERVAREIARKQMIVLEGVGRSSTAPST